MQLEIHLKPCRNEYSGIWEYELIEDVALVWEYHSIVIPRGFSYDGMSIPALAWQVIATPYDPSVMAPALIHDWLYTNHQVPREGTDLLFRTLLMEQEMSHRRAAAIYTAVRQFGESYWMNTEEDWKYINWLKDRLLTANLDILLYQFPVNAA